MIFRGWIGKDVGFEKDGTGAKEMALKIGKTHFIVVLNDEGSKAVDAKVGLEDIKNPMSLLAIDQIYSNRLGEQSSKQELDSAFDTTDKKEIVRKILLNGKYQ